LKKEIYDECMERVLRNDGKPFWEVLSKKFGYKNKDMLRNQFSRERKEKGKNAGFQEEDNTQYREVVEIKENGEIFSDKLIKICEEDLKSPEKMLFAHGFDPEKWILVTCKNNLWHGMRKNDLGRLILYQSKLVVKPKVESGLSLTDVDKFFESFIYDFKNNKRKAVPNKSGNILEINLADLHIGMRTIEEDISIAEKCSRVVDDIIYRTKNMKIEKILLIQLGDVFHYDTYIGTTSKGTFMASDMEFPSMFDEGAKIMIDVVERLTAIAPVEVINIFGNHDKVTAYTLAKSLEFYFKDRLDVEVDVSHLSRKARRFGNCLVVWAHGDMPKKNIMSLPQKEFRKEFGMTKYAEIHSGHFHSQSTQEKDGAIIRHLASMASLDGWSYEQGYVGGLKITISFLWNEEEGLKEIWFTNV
jgi:hypothetical protein